MNFVVDDDYFAGEVLWQVGDIVEIESSEGITIEAEIVKVTCPVCGEEHIGTKRASGGFIAGHQAYHEFVNATDMIMSTMGGQ